MSNANEMVARWRTNADKSNPAGPLFISGQFAEADIAFESNALTLNLVCESGRCGTACSGSSGHPCC